MNLADLPVEVVRRIASFSSFDSVLNLSYASRHFYKACEDWTVFRDVLKHTHPNIFRDMRGLSQKDSTWKAFASAAAKADTSSSITNDFLRWAPQMIALYRKSDDHPK